VPGTNVVTVKHGRLRAAGSLLRSLEAGGVFDWADSVLVPPRNMDVDSDPLRIELHTPKRSRLMVTREPHVPPLLVVLCTTRLEQIPTAKAQWT